MIRLPSNLRSLLHARCLVQRSSYSTAAAAFHYDELNSQFYPPSTQTSTSNAKTKGASKSRSLKSNKQAQRSLRTKLKKLSATPKQSQSATPKQSKREAEREVPRQAKKQRQDSQFALPKLSNDVIVREKDAKAQIYSYAAAAGLIPEFHVQSVERNLSGNKTTIVTVLIKLPEQGIEAVGIGKTYTTAEAQAAIDFKRQAEEYKSQHIDDEMIPGIGALTFDTGTQFFKYYKLFVKPHAKLDFIYDTETVRMSNNKRNTLNTAQLTIDDQPVGEKVSMGSKIDAEKLAHLVAAIEITKQDPNLLRDFQQALKEGNGEILQPVNVDLPVSSEILGVMEDALRDAKRVGLPRVTEALKSIREREQHTHRQSRRILTPTQLEYISKNLAIDLERFLLDPNLETLRARRQALPMNQYQGQVLKMINENLYSIVVGATGSGKTTQVPQILLDDAIKNGQGATCNIVCTQPRRIAATSVAQRVAEERNEKLCRTVWVPRPV